MPRPYRRRIVEPVPAPIVAPTTDSTDPEEPSMKILFQSVRLDITIPRHSNGTKGLANSETSYFDVEKAGCTIELDTAANLVRISKGDVSVFVPLGKVQYFGEVVSAAPPVARAV